MSPPDWGTVERLFEELVGLDPEQRRRRIDRIATDDPSLGHTLRRLLAAHDRSDELLAPLDALMQLPLWRAFDLGPDAPAGGEPAPGSAPLPPHAPDPLGLIGSTISGYEIRSVLGTGGMGVVYEAVDPRLARRAALKFLPAHLCGDPSYKTRFLREARAAAVLDHPNVCAIWEVGETTDGHLFIAMPRYAGQTVREMLRGGPLAPEAALDLACQAARGLEAAHAAGLVHRDIKPANLVVTDQGTLKILDFGVAKSDEPGLTLDGSRLGTPAYMSPEQTRGEEVGPETDYWALGAVLYEMVAGARPFPGDHPAAVIHQIQSEAPPPVETSGDPAAIRAAGIAAELLSKNPARRRAACQRLLAASAAPDAATDHAALRGDAAAGSPESVGGRTPPGAARPARGPDEVPGRSIWRKAAIGTGLLLSGLALGWLAFGRGADDAPGATGPGPAAGVPGDVTIAVLPFDAPRRTADARLAAGLHLDLITALSKIEGLRVTSRTSVMEYGGRRLPRPTVAAELGVDYLVEGRLRRRGDSVRVDLQLVDARTDEPRWAEVYAEAFSATRWFAFQADVAMRAAVDLGAQPGRATWRALETPPTTSTRALEAVHEASAIMAADPGFSAASWARALERYREAMRHDSGFVEARVGAAVALVRLYRLGAAGDSARDEARELLDRAVTANPELPLVHFGDGAFHYQMNDYPSALAAWLRAADLEIDADALGLEHWLAAVHRRQGDLESALSYRLRSIAMNPRGALQHVNLAFTYRLLRRIPEAVDAIDRAIELDSAQAFYWNVGVPIWREAHGAGPTLDRLTLAPGAVSIHPETLASRAALHQALGEHRRALGLLDLAGDEIPSQLGLQSMGPARAYSLLALGDSAGARATLTSSAASLEAALEDRPDGDDLLGQLGIVYAMLGRGDEAVDHARRAVEVMPRSRDYVVGDVRSTQLAVTLAWVGRSEEAIDVLRDLLSGPSGLTRAQLRADWEWEPLRRIPAFADLAAGRSGAPTDPS